MEEQVAIEGTVDSVIFQNSENSYTVFSMTIGEEKDMRNMICIAYIPNLNPGENIKVKGEFTTHPTYGKQFVVKSYEKIMPTTEKGIEAYLGSGSVKGIGKKLAARIVKHFGKDTFSIIESTPEKLSIIRGISKDKAIEIGNVFHEQAEVRSITIYLQEHGISVGYAMKIHKKYKSGAIDIINENPYVLVTDIFGIGFKIADDIAFKFGIDKSSPFRIKAGVRHCINTFTLSGNVYVYKSDLMEMSSSLLQVDVQAIENTIIEMQVDKSIVQEKIDGNVVIYLSSLYYAEYYVAKKLLELSENVINISIEDALKEVVAIEKSTNITLAQKQREAVMESMSKGVLVITGGPGTGKTTTINTILTVLSEEGYSIELAAPTGRAAKRMSEATGMEAKTIHRLLGISFLSEDSNRQAFEKNEESPIEADVVVIDEISMVDIMLMFNLLKAVEYGTRIILVGDANQLPSVGAGSVLKDIIDSECISVVRLSDIFRQARESAIVMNAHSINEGKYPKLNEKNKDFFFVKRTSMDDVTSGILELVTTRLPEYTGCDPLKDIQILTPMRKTAIGATNLNRVLQLSLNPTSPGKTEYEYRSTTFREGDKVMQIKNNYNMQWSIYDSRNNKEDEGLGVFNGDEGIIENINLSTQTLRVCFDDGKVVNYEFAQLEEIDLSYAITIHKSQGSEYKIVVIPVHSGPPLLLTRNLLYTAVTRAKTLVVLVGIEETLYRMVDNNKEVSRNSFLNGRLKNLKEL